VPDHDRESHPGTEAFVPDFSDSEDTGEPSVPFVPNFDDTGSQPISRSGTDTSPTVPKAPQPAAEHDAEKDSSTEPATGPVQPVTVPGRYLYLKWWKLALVILGVWLAAAEVGLSLFYWWYHTTDKTPAVFMVLVYVVACAVGGVMLAMVQGRALISALSVAVMSGPFASIVAAAPLYGYYYCARTGHCLVGVIPY
jgi:hypothetical protein